jgi:hypothetical protein
MTIETLKMPRSWREWATIARHPCASVFPMMGGADLAALADDIKAHGLREPITLLAVGAQRWVLDGRNRLAAAEAAGVALGEQDVRIVHDVEPAAFIISKNIRRRHLNKEEQASFIIRTVEAAMPDRATVALPVVRSAKGHLQGSRKDPVLTAAVEVGRQHGISRRTIQNARGKLQGKVKGPRGPAVSPAAPAPAPVAVASVAALVIDLRRDITRRRDSHFGTHRKRMAFFKWVEKRLDLIGAAAMTANGNAA